ncbi:MAG TPA: hypothetical protein DCL57_02600, partial [Microbacterium sp.]|nr:hypothetical protein [Microbacterium sp.]
MEYADSRSHAEESRADDDGWDLLSAFTEAEQSSPALVPPVAPAASPSAEVPEEARQVPASNTREPAPSAPD